MATSTIDLSAGMVPKAAASGGGGIDISAGLIPKPNAGLAPPSGGPSQQPMQLSYLMKALQPEGDIQNPQQPAESFALANPEQQGTLAGAAAIGAGGAAAPPVLSAGVNALLPAVTRGVVGVTAWAAQHPVAAKMIWEGLKASMYGTAAGAGAKMAGKIINASSGGE
jgi:hypothetical protein